jgi:hypothetical protein
MPEGKAGGSYLRVPPRLHFVPDASDTRPIQGVAASYGRREADGWAWAAGGIGAAPRAGYFPRVVLATLVVTVLPGLAAAALQPP